MLVVDPEQRFTIDQCLEHPWLKHGAPGVNDSTGGLVGGLAGLEMGRRAPARERTLLASLNTVQVAAQVAVGDNRTPVKVFSKNKSRIINAPKEAAPDSERAPGVFMEMGGKGDQQLYPDESASIYPANDAALKAEKNSKKSGR